MSEDSLLAFIKEMVISLGNFAPKLIGFVLLIIIGWIIARILSNITMRVLLKTKIDNFTEKLDSIDFIRKSKVRIKLSSLLPKVFYYVILLLFVIAGLDILGIEALSRLFRDFVNYLPNVLVAGVILIFGLIFADSFKKVVITATQSMGLSSGKLIANFVFYFMVINIVILALGQAKIETDFLAENISYVFAGGIFAFALGYGIASKDTVSNYLASFYTKDKISLGDRITVAGKTGKVIDMDKSSVIIKTESGRAIIPLRKLNNEDIEIHD